MFADLDTASYQLDPDDVERKITDNTKALMPVHMMGQPSHLERFMALARKRGLKVIEDACQAHLAEYQGKRLGNHRRLGFVSASRPAKTIACGEGGAILGDNEELMDKCYTVHNHGTNRRGARLRLGPNTE